MSCNKLVVFRTDANSIIGTGHVIRCSILANKLQQLNYKIHFICQDLPLQLQKRLKNCGYEIWDMPSTDLVSKSLLTVLAEIGQNFSKRILIIDSDNVELYDTLLQQEIREQHWKLMYFTFNNHYHFYADIVLNQNIRGPELIYRKEQYTRLLLGTKYVILKDEYRELKTASILDFNTKENTCLLFFGGSDSKGQTLRVLKSLFLKPNLFSKVIVISGSLNRDNDLLRQMAADAPMQVDLYTDTPRMPELMVESKYAITSGGLTIWELATLQTLQLIIPTSERELVTVQYCASKEWVHHLKDVSNSNDEELINLIYNIIADPSNAIYVKNFSTKVAIDGADKVSAIIDEVVSFH